MKKHEIARTNNALTAQDRVDRLMEVVIGIGATCGLCVGMAVGICIIAPVAAVAYVLGFDV